MGGKDDISIDNFKDLNKVLKNTFSVIKKDLEETKNDLLFNVNTIKAINKELEDSRKDYVSIDKLNNIKIKIGDISEDIKKIDRIEKSLKDISTGLKERIDELDKKSAGREKTEKDIRDLQNQLSVVDTISKTSVTDAQLKQLAKEVSKEINEMRKGLLSFEEKGGKITNAAIEKLKTVIEKDFEEFNNKIELRYQEITNKAKDKEDILKEKIQEAFKKFKASIAGRMNALDEQLQKTAETSKTFVNKQQINDLLRDINKEFDEVREEVEDVKLLKRDIQSLGKEKVGRTTFNKEIEGIKEDIEGMKEIEADLKDLDNNKVSKTAHEKTIFDLSNRIEKLKDQMTQLNAIKKEMKTSAGKEKVQKAEKKVTLYGVASFFLFFSFFLLGLSFISWFFDKIGLMNWFVYTAVAVFIIGLVIRVIVVIRE